VAGGYGAPLGLERIEDLEQGRLVQGHRVIFLRETLAGCKDSHDGRYAIRSLAATYTTPRDTSAIDDRKGCRHTQSGVSSSFR
jgi:hypothetical protein